MSETIVWEFYDPVRHAGRGGNYIFLLKSFNNAPYYAGEAGSFQTRVFTASGSHKKSFAKGERTFMRPLFHDWLDHSHRGFAERWHNYKQKTAYEQEELLYVPKISFYSEEIGYEGKQFWASNVALLVSPNSLDCRGRCGIESRVQLGIMEYYKHIVELPFDWKIPRTGSKLMGNKSSSVTSPTLLYQLGNAQPMSACSFFAKLTYTRV